MEVKPILIKKKVFSTHFLSNQTNHIIGSQFLPQFHAKIPSHQENLTLAKSMCNTSLHQVNPNTINLTGNQETKSTLKKIKNQNVI